MYDPNSESDDEDGDEETTIFTFVCGGGCGQMLNWKTGSCAISTNFYSVAAVKHTNRCAAKMETQMNYDGPNISHNPHNMLCLAMNKQSKQYCRRIRFVRFRACLDRDPRRSRHNT